MHREAIVIVIVIVVAEGWIRPVFKGISDNLLMCLMTRNVCAAAREIDSSCTSDVCGFAALYPLSSGFCQ